MLNALFFHSDNTALNGSEFISHSLYGIVCNTAVGLIAFSQTTGSYLLLYGASTTHTTISPRVLNTLSALASTLIGAYVGECVTYKPVPAAQWVGLNFEPEWIGLVMSILGAFICWNVVPDTK